MIRKLLAGLLLLLAASPFTAPFSTCDMATLVGDDLTGRHGWAATAIRVDHSENGALCSSPQRPRAPMPLATHAAAAPARARAITLPVESRLLHPVPITGSAVPLRI